MAHMSRLVISTIVAMAIGAGCIAAALWLVVAEVQHNREETLKNRQVGELILQVACQDNPTHPACKDIAPGN